MIMKSCLKVICGALFSLFLIDTCAQADTDIGAESPANSAAGYFISVNTLPPFAAGMNAGYQFTRNLGVQAGVIGIWESDFGLEVDTAAIYDIALRGVVPIGNHGEFFSKLGVGIIDGQVNVSAPLIGTIKQNGQSMGPTFGVGFGYYFTRRWVGTVEYTGIYSVGSSVLKDGIKGLPMIGVTYHFVG
jgi:hypothetical protein